MYLLRQHDEHPATKKDVVDEAWLFLWWCAGPIDAGKACAVRPLLDFDYASMNEWHVDDRKGLVSVLRERPSDALEVKECHKSCLGMEEWTSKKKSSNTYWDAAVVSGA